MGASGKWFRRRISRALRVWEHISNGDYLLQASANGDAIVDLATQPTEAEPPGYANAVAVFAARPRRLVFAGHLACARLRPGVGIGNGSEYRFFSEDLSRGIVQPFGGIHAALAGSDRTDGLPAHRLPEREAQRSLQGRCYRPLVTPRMIAARARSSGERTPRANAKVSYAAHDSKVRALTPAMSFWPPTAQLTSASNGRVRALRVGRGRLRLVSVLPEGEAEGWARRRNRGDA